MTPKSSMRIRRMTRAAHAVRRATPAKQDGLFFKYRDALEFPLGGAGRPDFGVPACVYIEPPGRPREFVRRAPEFHLDPDRVGLFSSFPEDTITSPPPFVVFARNARVTGFRTILSEDGFLFNDDSISEGLQRDRFLKQLGMPYPLDEETGFTSTAKNGEFGWDLGERTVHKIRGTTVILTSAEPSNYGSWLFRVLPKLQSLRGSDGTKNRRVSYLIWCDIPSFRDYLDLLGVPEDRVIHHDTRNSVYELERAIVPSMRNNQAFLDPQTVALFAGLRERFGARRRGSIRLYVSRLSQKRGGNGREMRNEPELVDRLVRMGFRAVCPETLSVVEQIALFSSAEMVVGPSGSGMFNIVFCRPGTKVIDIESEPHWIHAHRSLFASAGMRYGFVVGAAADKNFKQHHKPWSVNIEALIAQIKAWT